MEQKASALVWWQSEGSISLLALFLSTTVYKIKIYTHPITAFHLYVFKVPPSSLKKVIPGSNDSLTVTISWSGKGPVGTLACEADLMSCQRHLLMQKIKHSFSSLSQGKSLQEWQRIGVMSQECCFLVLTASCNCRQSHQYVYWFSSIRFLADGVSKGAWNDKDKNSWWFTHPYVSYRFFRSWRCGWGGERESDV